MYKTTITGHVGNVKFTEQAAVGEKPGFTVLSFSVASNAKTTAGKPITHWTTCKLWGPRGKSLQPHLTKGQAVAVEGRPEANAYLGNDGKPKSEFVVHVSEFEFIGGKPDNAPATVVGEDAVDGADDTPSGVEA